FVLVNSIALQGDGCSICEKVEKDLHQLSLALNCSRQLDPNHSNENCKEKDTFPASAPILLQVEIVSSVIKQLNRCCTSLNYFVDR
ncbi:hypothetical protein scyTo_0023636, partial [Scyliorhinus torazame]|nr:hypothetical protein [Scyliorhinus torazame]